MSFKAIMIQMWLLVNILPCSKYESEPLFKHIQGEYFIYQQGGLALIPTTAA